jgi:hypothetical protein
MSVMIVGMVRVRVVVAAMIVAMLMVLVVMTMPMAFLCALFAGLAGFDMDMGNRGFAGGYATMRSRTEVQVRRRARVNPHD